MTDDLLSIGFMAFLACVMMFSGCVAGYRDEAVFRRCRDRLRALKLQDWMPMPPTQKAAR